MDRALSSSIGFQFSLQSNPAYKEALFSLVLEIER